MIQRLLGAAAAVSTAAAALLLPALPAHADQIRSSQWHLRALNVAAAHEVSQGAGVTVAVIDSGVDPHPEIRNNLLPGTDLVRGGTGDGRDDTDGHGTAMAGLIAAHGKGASSGALGIAPAAKILPVRTETSIATGNNVDLAGAIRYAITSNVDVISISSGGAPDPLLQDAVEAAIAADIVVVAAGGNRPNEVVITFPAFYDGVVAVGATDRAGNRASVSVTGDKLALTAPGVDIYSTSFNGKYYRGTGTSASTAIVAGAAALVRSKYPDLSAQEVIHRLTATATDKGAPGRDPEYGYGVLNLVAALTADVPPLQASGAPATPSADARPTAVDITALPDDPADEAILTGGRAALLCGLPLLIVAVIVVILMVTRQRRREPPAPPGSGTQGPAAPGPAAPPQAAPGQAKPRQATPEQAPQQTPGQTTPRQAVASPPQPKPAGPGPVAPRPAQPPTSAEPSGVDPPASDGA